MNDGKTRRRIKKITLFLFGWLYDLKISLLEIYCDFWILGESNCSSFLVEILRIGFCDYEGCLFQIGWLQGNFQFDLFWIMGIFRAIERWRDR